MVTQTVANAIYTEIKLSEQDHYLRTDTAIYSTGSRCTNDNNSTIILY